MQADCQLPAQVDRHHGNGEGSQDIQPCQHLMPAPKEGHGLQTEGRQGGESPQEAHGGEDAQGLRQQVQLMCEGQQKPHDKSHEKATDGIDDQSGQGELPAPGHTNETGQPIAADCPQTAADKGVDEIFHGFFHFPVSIVSLCHGLAKENIIRNCSVQVESINTP